MKSDRILILRPDNIGDVVLFAGAFRHIRHLHPDAHITLAVQEHIVNLVELCPYIDAFVSLSRISWLEKLRGAGVPFELLWMKTIRILNKFWNIYKQPFDIIIYPIKSPQIHHLEVIDCLKAKKVLGITGCCINTPKNGYPRDLRMEKLLTNHVDSSQLDQWTHELNITLKFLEYLGCKGINTDDIKPEFWLSNSERNCLEELNNHGQQIVGIFPSASFSKRQWAPANYGEFARLLGGQPVYVIFGSTADKCFAAEVAKSIEETSTKAIILNLTGKTTLRELVKAISLCDLLLGVESAGLHIAIAMNIPSVGIVGGGHFGRFVPWGNPDKSIFLTNKMECLHCNWRCTRETFECIQGVSPRQVAAASKKLLAQEI